MNFQPTPFEDFLLQEHAAMRDYILGTLRPLSEKSGIPLMMLFDLAVASDPRMCAEALNTLSTETDSLSARMKLADLGQQHDDGDSDEEE